jgi:MSHA biogenesis protein MshQ
VPIAASAFAVGVGNTVTLPTYILPAYTGIPTVTPTDFYVRAIDGDNVTSFRTTSIEAGLKVAYGQIKVSNVYGSELLPLMVTATAQYYSPNSNWVTSITDNVTALTLPSTYLVGTGSANVTPTPTATMNAGKVNINLSKPGVPGVVLINPPHPSSNYLPLIPGTATFGIYNGNKNIIYQRESY